jgi:hypothetical protein
MKGSFSHSSNNRTPSRSFVYPFQILIEYIYVYMWKACLGLLSEILTCDWNLDASALGNSPRISLKPDATKHIWINKCFIRPTFLLNDNTKGAVAFTYP